MIDRFAQRPSERRGELLVKHASERFAETFALSVAAGECAVFTRGSKLFGIVGEGEHTLHVRAHPFLSEMREPGGYAATLFFVTTAPMSGVKFGGLCGTLCDREGRNAQLIMLGELTMQVADAGRFVADVGEASAEDVMALLAPKLLPLAAACAAEWLEGGYYTLDTLAGAGPQLAQTIAPNCHASFAELGLAFVRIDSLALQIR